MSTDSWELSEELRQIQDTVSRFMAAEVKPAEDKLPHDAYELPTDVLERLQGKAREIPVKSIIASPQAHGTVSAGGQLVQGFAWSGNGKITNVDLTFDDAAAASDHSGAMTQHSETSRGDHPSADTGPRVTRDDVKDVGRLEAAAKGGIRRNSNAPRVW